MLILFECILIELTMNEQKRIDVQTELIEAVMRVRRRSSFQTLRRAFGWEIDAYTNFPCLYLRTNEEIQSHEA